MEIFLTNKHQFLQLIYIIERMNDMQMLPHKFTTAFIELYKSFPCLYNVKSEGYAHKELRNTCYSKMVDKPKEIDPIPTKGSVVNKIDNMRSSYRNVSQNSIHFECFIELTNSVKNYFVFCVAFSLEKN